VCSVEKTCLISCQISFYPLYTCDSTGPVNEVVAPLKFCGKIGGTKGFLANIPV
jgi:hypothetical protein